MRSIIIDSRPAIDAKWYQRLLEATSNISEFFIMLEPTQEQLRQERAKFEASGYTSYPDLLPYHLDESTLTVTIDSLKKLLADITTHEKNQHVIEAYKSHIQEKVSNLEMIQASLQGDHEEFIAHNIALYGMPDHDIFAATCAWIRIDAEATLVAENTELIRAREAVLRLLPDIHGDESILLPSEAVFSEVRTRHFAKDGYFDQLFAPYGLPEEPYIDQLSGDAITRRAIQNVGSDYQIKTASDGLWAVLPLSRQVVRPAGYRVDRDYFAGVIAHEVGSHLLEESNGAKQPLRLLRLGLGGYEKGNEGRAFLREQIMYDSESICASQSSWEYILMLHLGVSLASGLHKQSYTFAELYEVLFVLHRFYRQRRYPRDTINEAQAREEAWLLAVRIMKGTMGKGGCYMKDTVYLEGNLNCWLIAAQDPEIILYGDMGKFNIADPVHIRLLRNLNLLSDIG